MPQSRELQNKKNTHKDRQSRGPAGSGAEPKKHGAGGHNWGNALDDYQHPTTEVVDPTTRTKRRLLHTRPSARRPSA
ncbi:hypothetical protein SPRG_08161 [Saprolegnia parasitica CBS 223.65]|uniref:Hyaluronan/mRNA-binding protein domain-containing protein n=1 Tax=Saprolegnia parasitica (strain CBS 223.65) TaxID=695850 RepID=A0A067CJ83_SAPPC|nr:hypothetical protein SPRG_08161 [Saprolegnia parasitica CBS 223.65]KDO26872.1 hypothetical protein SPRG_08161 [Saprolegnia parasitica CBS 223.65]|eukprot:XP_012202515.1 hypothetical protein SPRG_08161 [Saprolegnia parasitica CBS 223.65]